MKTIASTVVNPVTNMLRPRRGVAIVTGTDQDFKELPLGGQYQGGPVISNPLGINIFQGGPRDHKRRIENHSVYPLEVAVLRFRVYVCGLA